MEPISVGIREFRARLAEFLLKNNHPVAVTRHGATIGYFIPTRPARAEVDRAALAEAAARFDKLLKDSGVSESDVEEIAAEFRTWRKVRRKG
jgi:PHD/YefM family antitoxin component YafN of YafNO toxin-antitoxin module